MAGVAETLAASAAVEVEVRSAHGPWLTWTPATGAEPARATPSPSPRSSGPGWFVRWLKPEVIVTTAFGTVRRAPGGHPLTTTWPMVPVVLGVVVLSVLALAAVGAASLLRGR